MARTESIILKELIGQIGHQIVFKQYGNKTVVSKYPDMSKRKLSKKQKQVNEMMTVANAEAKAILADEKLAKEAQARLNVTRNKLYTSLIREYFAKAKK